MWTPVQIPKLFVSVYAWSLLWVSGVLGVFSVITFGIAIIHGRFFAGGSLVFVAPPPRVITVTVDGVDHRFVGGQIEEVQVKHGPHWTRTDGIASGASQTLNVGHSESFLVPVTDLQCFALFDATGNYAAVRRPPELMARIPANAPFKLPGLVGPRNMVLGTLPAHRSQSERTYWLKPVSCDDLDSSAEVLAAP